MVKFTKIKLCFQSLEIRSALSQCSISQIHVCCLNTCQSFKVWADTNHNPNQLIGMREIFILYTAMPGSHPDASRSRLKSALDRVMTWKLLKSGSEWLPPGSCCPFWMPRVMIQHEICTRMCTHGHKSMNCQLESVQSYRAGVWDRIWLLEVWEWRPCSVEK